MPEESSEDRTWLLAPPGAGIARINIELGEGVELDDNQRAAINSLVTAFFESDVEGFAMADQCRPLTCEPKEVFCAIHERCGKFTCEVGVMPSMGILS